MGKEIRALQLKALIIVSIYILGVFAYVKLGRNTFEWLLFEKMNDRVLVLALLISLIFNISDSTFKILLSIFSLFLFLYAVYESTFIYDRFYNLPIRVNANDFAIIAIAYFSLFAIGIIAGLVVDFYNKKR